MILRPPIYQPSYKMTRHMLFLAIHSDRVRLRREIARWVEEAAYQDVLALGKLYTPHLEEYWHDLTTRANNAPGP